MPLIVPDVGEVILLDKLVAGDDLSSLECRLYRVSITIDQDTVIGDFTVANFSGYTAQTFAFGAASIVSHKGKIVATAPVVFTHNGGGTANTIFGYYIVDTDTSEVVWAEVFPSSQVMTNNGDQISITLQLTLNSEN